jgi:hypothetical protein
MKSNTKLIVAIIALSLAGLTAGAAMSARDR